MLKQLTIDPARLVQRAQDLPHSPQSYAPAIATHEAAKKPRLVDAEADFRIPAAVWSAWTPSQGSRALARPLTGGQRMQLVTREMELREGLRPFNPQQQDEALAAIASMLGGFRSLKQGELEAAATLDGIRCVVAEFPLWAIKEGCLAIQRGAAMVDGRRLDRRFPPNDGEVYGVIDDLVKPYQQTLQRVSALLSAPVEVEPCPASITYIRKPEP